MSRSHVLVALGLAVSSSAAVQAPILQRLSPLETRVTVRVRRVPLRRFLQAVSAQGRVSFILADGLEKRRVTADLHGATVAQSLEVLGRAAGLSFQRLGQGQAYLVSTKAAAAKPLELRGSAVDRRVTVDVSGAPLTGLFEQLSAQTKVGFTLAPGLETRRVTAHLRDVRLADALLVLREVKGLAFRQTARNAFIVAPGPQQAGR